MNYTNNDNKSWSSMELGHLHNTKTFEKLGLDCWDLAVEKVKQFRWDQKLMSSSSWIHQSAKGTDIPT